ncbi:hypothetical protein [Streptomyces sp. KL118A]|uniref:hypothetical protein n=1 Tax=Streptomyces sp. KL118A TaxID=3045153 RepID=UPI00278C0A3F|nr:hypothetical protein [Streptomyces sp. KL118A]
MNYSVGLRATTDPLLPVLTFPEAQELMLPLAAMLEDGKADEEAADRLLPNLAARVPSRG